MRDLAEINSACRARQLPVEPQVIAVQTTRQQLGSLISQLFNDQVLESFARAVKAGWRECLQIA